MNGLAHTSNRREGKTKVAHNRHAGHAKALRAIKRRRARRQTRVNLRERMEGWR